VSEWAGEVADGDGWLRLRQGEHRLTSLHHCFTAEAYITVLAAGQASCGRTDCGDRSGPVGRRTCCCRCTWRALRVWPERDRYRRKRLFLFHGIPRAASVARTVCRLSPSAKNQAIVFVSRSTNHLLTISSPSPHHLLIISSSTLCSLLWLAGWLADPIVFSVSLSRRRFLGSSGPLHCSARSVGQVALRTVTVVLLCCRHSIRGTAGRCSTDPAPVAARSPACWTESQAPSAALRAHSTP
jgi:hypothetical protein